VVLSLECRESAKTNLRKRSVAERHQRIVGVTPSRFSSSLFLHRSKWFHTLSSIRKRHISLFLMRMGWSSSFHPRKEATVSRNRLQCSSTHNLVSPFADWDAALSHSSHVYDPETGSFGCTREACQFRDALVGERLSWHLYRQGLDQSQHLRERDIQALKCSSNRHQC